MKVLHIITSLKIGGAERALYNLIDSLSHENMQHCVAYFHDGPIRQELEKLNIPTYSLNGFIYRYDIITIYKFYKLIQHTKPNVIHTSLWMANILGRLAGSWFKIPVISAIHGMSQDEGFLRNFFDRVTCSYAQNIVSVSASVQSNYKKTIIQPINNQQQQHTLIKKLCCIPNGINIQKTQQYAQQNPLKRNDFLIPENAFVLGAVGRLEPIKSYDILIRAFAHFLKNIRNNSKQRTCKLLIVGDGSQAKNLKNLAHNLNIKQNVIFAGSRSDAYRFYPLFDCFTLSSQSEGMSIALLEALAFKKPIITTHISNVHDVITDGIEGFIIPTNNIPALANSFEKLYTNPILAQKMGNAGFCRIAEHFSLTTTSQAYAQLFNQNNILVGNILH